MGSCLAVAVDDVPLLIEALRAYAPHLAAEAAIESDAWLSAVFDTEARRAALMADELLRRLRELTS